MTEKPNSEFEDALHRFIDGDMCEDDKLDMIDYLDEHPLDAERVDELLQQNNMLRALRRGLDIGDSRQFCPDLQSKIIAELERPTHWWRRFGASALAASIALAAVVTALWYGVDNRPIAKETPITPEVQKQLADGPSNVDSFYLPFGRQKPVPPADFADADGIIPESEPFDWFNAKLTNRLIRQPDLSGHGLHLVTVYVLSEKPTPALHLLYKDQAGQLVEVFAGVLSPEQSGGMHLVRDGHISIHWRMGDLLFALIAPTDSPQLGNIVASVTQAVESTVEEAALSTDDPVVDEMLPGNESGDSEIAINDIELASPTLTGPTIMFVPVPRPAREHIPVEPPQALPPSEAVESPEPL